MGPDAITTTGEGAPVPIMPPFLTVNYIIALQGIYPSHFDFKNQTLMYVPNDLPIPNDPDFGTEVAKRIADIG